MFEGFLEMFSFGQKIQYQDRYWIVVKDCARAEFALAVECNENGELNLPATVQLIGTGVKTLEHKE